MVVEVWVRGVFGAAAARAIIAVLPAWSRGVMRQEQPRDGDAACRASQHCLKRAHRDQGSYMKRCGNGKRLQACLSKYRSADPIILYFLAENSPQRTPGCVACMRMMAPVLESPSPDMRYLCSSVQLRNSIDPFVRLAPDPPRGRAW